MGERRPILFAQQSYRLDSLKLAAQRCVNGYASQHPRGSKSPIAIHGTPGIAEWAECGTTGPVRGMHTMAGTPFVVSGEQLFTIDRYGTETQVGAGITGTGPVSMADNGTEVGIVYGGFGWTYDATNGLRQITSPNFYSAKTIAFFKNLFAFDREGTNEFFHSDTLDGQGYGATNSGAAETSSDRVMAVVEHKGHLMVFGEATIEPWFFSGAIAFPFQQYDGAAVQRGLGAALAVAKEDEALFFLGNDRMHYRLNGLQPVVQSTIAIAEAWQKHESILDAHSFAYTFGGRKFVVVHFPTAHQTWVLDISTGLWHERQSLDHGGTPIRWRGNCTTRAHGKVLIGDFLSPKVGYMDNSIFTEFGDTVGMKLTAPILHGEMGRVFLNSLELDIDAGVGLASGQGSDPQVVLSLSDNGGNSFYPLEQWQGMGQIGDHRARLRWDALGSFFDGVLQFEITDPVRRTIIAAYADTDLGT